MVRGVVMTEDELDKALAPFERKIKKQQKRCIVSDSFIDSLVAACEKATDEQIKKEYKHA
jgi:hypothetical protein